MGHLCSYTTMTTWTPFESTAGTDTLKEMLEEWWEVTDRKSALETISWLLNEGQHAGADPAFD